MDVSQFGEQRIIDTLIADAQPLQLNGATCDTYYARLHGRRVFIKRLKEKYRLDPRYLAALEKEFKLGYRLEHKALPRYISFEQDAIVMDFVEGVTLTQFIKENPEYFSLKKNIDKFMMQLLEGVKYLHHNSILHLDLKPENVMISHIGNDVHIIDLGFCYSDAFNDTIGYTHSFAAPEQEGKSQVKVGTYTDIFAIGKILEYILTRQKRKRYLNIARKCQNENPQQRPEIETLLSLFSATWQWKKGVWIATFLVAILVVVGIFVFANKPHIENEIEPKQSITETKQEINHQSVTVEDSPKINNIPDKTTVPQQTSSKSTSKDSQSSPQPTYKYPAPDYPYQSVHSTLEVKRDWYRELRPIYDKMLAQYMATDSMLWFNSDFQKCAYQLIENQKTTINKKHSTISTDDIYNDGMHVYTMILWMHEGLPVEISGYKRPPRPDLTKYAIEQIALFEKH